jgi:hypothetical protein
MSPTKLFLLALLGSLLCVSCGSRTPPQDEAPAQPPPPRGVTQNLPQRQEGTIYVIDAVGPVASPMGKTVSAFAARALPIAGWAIDSPNKLPASNVDVVIDGIPYAAHYGVPRKDVAAYLKDNRYETSGFEFSMPAGVLAKGSHTLSIRVVGSDGKSYVQSPGITVVLE